MQHVWVPKLAKVRCNRNPALTMNPKKEDGNLIT